MMKLEKKVIVQSNVIKQLQRENEELKAQLDLERNISKEGYKKAKELIEQTEKTKAEYEKLILELKETKEKYQNEMRVLSTNVKERNKKIDGISKLFTKIAI